MCHLSTQNFQSNEKKYQNAACSYEGRQFQKLPGWGTVVLILRLSDGVSGETTTFSWCFIEILKACDPVLDCSSRPNCSGVGDTRIVSFVTKPYPNHVSDRTLLNFTNLGHRLLHSTPFGELWHALGAAHFRGIFLAVGKAVPADVWRILTQCVPSSENSNYFEVALGRFLLPLLRSPPTSGPKPARISIAVMLQFTIYTVTLHIANLKSIRHCVLFSEAYCGNHIVSKC